MANILSDVGSIVSSGFDWAESAVDFITGTPLVLFFTLIGLVGIGIGLVKRAIS